jgi:hypothetical protein
VSRLRPGPPPPASGAASDRFSGRENPAAHLPDILHRIKRVADYIGQVLHDLAYGQQPDQDLEETEQRRQELLSPRDEDDADRAQGDVEDAGDDCSSENRLKPV